MNTITKCQILEADKLATLYAGELRGKGYTPAKTLAVTSDKYMRVEFQNGELNQIILPIGKLCSWAKLFADTAEFRVEFPKNSRNSFCIAAGSSFVGFTGITPDTETLKSLCEVPPIRFDDNHTSRFELQKPIETGDLSTKLKAIKAGKAFAKVRDVEISAKRALKLAASEHCARLAILGEGTRPAIARARLIIKARRILRGALKMPEMKPAWLTDAAKGDVYAACLADLNVCRASLSAYKPRMVKDRWSGEKSPVYGPKYVELQNKVHIAGQDLKRAIESAWQQEMELNGLPKLHDKYDVLRTRELSRARLAARDWTSRKWQLSQDYIAALGARRKAEPKAYAAGGIVLARAITITGEKRPAVILTQDTIAAQFQKAADNGASIEILKSEFAAFPVGFAKLPPAQTIQINEAEAVAPPEVQTIAELAAINPSVQLSASDIPDMVTVTVFPNYRIIAQEMAIEMRPRVVAIRRDENGEVINGNFPTREASGPVILPPIPPQPGRAIHAMMQAGEKLAALMRGETAASPAPVLCW